LRLILERRGDRSTAMAVLSPLLAILLTLIVGGIIFWFRDIDPLQGLYVYFVEPLTDDWAREKLIVKATPLILMGAGLAICYTANVWNIGAEGQFVMGALLAGAIPVMFPAWQSFSVLPVMLAVGIFGGLALAMIPAALRVRYKANEILTSLMLVYVARLFYDYCVRGPMRDPLGMNFPKTIKFTGWQALPRWGDIHLGAAFAIIAAMFLAFLMWRMIKGFELRVIGQAPRAARFAGFSENRAIYFCFAISGGLAGLAGACDVMGVGRQLQTPYEPNYGFVAIIVAFLGRLNPIGAIIAGLVLALSFIGGEAAQSTLHVSDKIARVFQGILLFFILACDTLILYRIKLLRRA
jgi:general nucleoside transport system permease protein